MNDDCVTDSLTGLIWLKSPDLTARTWGGALAHVGTMSYCGSTDWRLPNIHELESLVNLGQNGSASWLNQQNGFVGIASGKYWSSTTASSSTATAWTVDFGDNGRYTADKGQSYYVLPVLGSTDGSLAEIWKTGQTAIYGAGDDGDLKTGITWPSPRFSNLGNGTVRDNLTALIWTVDANAPGPEICSPRKAKIVYYSYLYIQCLNNNNYLGYSDWRLPNRKELGSLLDYSRSNPALSQGHPFLEVASGYYWTSDTYLGFYSMGWPVDMGTGQSGPLYKNAEQNTLSVWPVRGPLTLKVLLDGDGKGSIRGDELSCSGGRCLGVYNNGDVITLTAESSADSVFGGWTGCASPIGNECSIFMDEDITVTASFLAAKSIWDKPSSLNVGKVGFNVPSENKYVVVKNTNETNLQVKTVSLAGVNSGEYALDENCSGVTLPPGEACTILLSINAQDYGTRHAELVVTFNDPKVPVVKLKLKAKAVPAKIFVKPRSLNFRKVSTSGSSPQQLTIQNNGVTPLSILSIVNTGDNGGDFTIDPSSCPVLQDGQLCSITVTFAPGGVGKRSGTLTITSDAPKKWLVYVKLKGEGI